MCVRPGDAAPAALSTAAPLRHKGPVHILFDATLLLMLPFWPEPAGIDRVVLAHLRHWRRFPPAAVTFVARTPLGDLSALPDGGGRELLAALDAGLAAGRQGAVPLLKARAGKAMAAHLLGAGRRRLGAVLARHPGAALLNASGHLLHAPRAVAAARAAGARFVPLLHDVLPLTHPEWSPPSGARRCRQRMALVAGQADGAVMVSAAARDEATAWLAGQGLRVPPMAVAHPGLDLPFLDPAPPPPPHPPGRPAFVVLSTLAPRKNHLLLLQLWKELAARDDAPDLLLVGRRAWENATAYQMLDRTDFRGRVRELGRLPDTEAAAVLRGATALLFPSLAEGYGIPLAEALALGVPAIASDIPPFREVGGAVPEFLHPLDGPGWRRAVLDYAAPGSPRRAAQLARLPGWHPPRWEEHFAAVEAFLATLPPHGPDPRH